MWLHIGYIGARKGTAEYKSTAKFAISEKLIDPKRNNPRYASIPKHLGELYNLYIT